jgi:exodeoxyribonuclease V alpha subunit
MENSTLDTVVGTIEKIVFFNKENGYTVARLIQKKGTLPITIIGYLPDLRAGERIQAQGRKEDNSKFGPQFRVSAYEIIPPSSTEGIEKYLSSGLIKGIGPVMAERIVNRFGPDTLRVISEEPERLREVQGIGRKTFNKIITSWEEQKELRQTMIFLQSHGITPAYASKILKQYGGAAARVVTEEPYRLAYDIQGIGFKQADSIARKMGIPHDSPSRAAAAALHILNEMAGEGHVYMPKDMLINKCREMLEISASIIENGMITLGAEKKIVVERKDDEEAVYLAHLYTAEAGAAHLLKALGSSLKLLPPIDAAKAARWFEKKRGITLNKGQNKAIQKAIDNKVLVITGGPGTGKTTIVQALVEIFRAKEQRVQLAAPTGRAAKRMEEVAKMPAATIHRLLEFSPVKMSFARDRDNPLECDIIIIDETSMLDVVLLYHLLKAVPIEASLIFIGDADQLPSVGPGNVLRDLIESGCADVVKLTEIFRQARGSLIIDNAHRINRGEEPSLSMGKTEREKDFHFIERARPEEVASTIETLVTSRIPQAFGMDTFIDVQVLSPMHKGTAGVSDLNLRLQHLLNPSGPELAHGARVFRMRDKVMQIKNNYEKDVFNGDLGLVSSVDHDTQQLAVTFDGRILIYEYSELDELELAYAISVHKSQGSEYRAVVVPVLTQHFMLLQRNLMYTAVTRGKELVVLVGSREALSMAIKNARIRHRHTHLSERLQD